MSSDDSPRLQFLPVPGTGVVIPLGDLAPESIKPACGVRALVKPGGPRPKGMHQTLLNHVAFHLGMDSWSPAALEALPRQIARLGGLRRVDMFRRSDRLNDFSLRPTARQVCDRLFHSGEGVASIYTGYGVPFETFDDAPLMAGLRRDGLDSGDSLAQFKASLSRFSLASDTELFDKNVERARQGDAAVRRSFVATYGFDLNQGLLNYLGDAFVNAGTRPTVVPTMCWHQRPLEPELEQRYRRLVEVLLVTLRELAAAGRGCTG